jgi:hypothetical protein
MTCNMSDIQDSQSSLTSEIDRLKRINVGLVADQFKVSRTTEEAMAQIEEVVLTLVNEHRALLARAADALEEEFGSPDAPEYGVKGPVHELIADLRKAAE